MVNSGGCKHKNHPSQCLLPSVKQKNNTIVWNKGVKIKMITVERCYDMTEILSVVVLPFSLPCLTAQWAQTQQAAPLSECCLTKCLACKGLKTTPQLSAIVVLKSSQIKTVIRGSETSLMTTITFLRWPSLNLKISSCSWYSACDNLQQDTEPNLVQFKLCTCRENLWKKPCPYASLSVPFVLLLRLFCSKLGGGVWAMEGGLRLARSFLCLSMSSRWELILSCCLETE